MASSILKVIMGSSSSAPSVREQHRLSKPRTNTNGAFSLPKLDIYDSPTSPIKSPIVAEEEVVVRTSSGEHRSRQDARQHIRAQLFSNNSSETTVVAGESNENLRDLASHVKDRLESLSRSGSVVSQLPSAHTSTTRLNNSQGASKLSLVPDPHQIDIETAITILQELRKTASPEDLIALHKALLPTRKPEPSPTRVSALPKGPSMHSTSSLIRRRSLAAPGLATRTQDLLRKPDTPPQPKHAEDHVWKENMFETSPLARLASLDIRDEDRRLPVQRAETPADMEYSHLGGFKLGSLVITNGMASPAPSIMMSKNVSRRQSTPDLQHREDDYFTASEGCASPARPAPDSASQTELPSRRSRSPAVPVSRRARPRSEAPRHETNGSPLRTETRRDDSDDDCSNSGNLKPDSSTRQARRFSALDLAENYMAELPTSPYVAQNFVEEDVTRDGEPHSQQDTATIRAQALRKLDGTFAEAVNAPVSRSSASKLSPLPNLPQNDALRLGRPVHAKVDSGYSSVSSLSTLKTGWYPEDDGSVYSRRASQYETSRATGRGDTRSVHSSEQTLPSSSSDSRSINASRPTTRETADAPEEERARKSNARRKSFIRSVSLGKAKHRSLSSISTSPDPSTVPPTQSPEKPARKGKKLQKQRPNSRGDPIVQGQRPIRAGSIPYVPDDVVAKFCKRIKSSPDMEHLNRTYASVAAESKESLEEPIPPAVPIIFPGDSTRNSLCFDAEVEKLPPPPPPHRQAPTMPSHHRSASHSHKGNSGHKLEDYEFIGVSDFGTVAKSLGGSPYDIAMSALKAQSSTKPTQPHHLSTNLMAQSSLKPDMGSETAAAYAPTRSRDRIEPPARNARSMSRPRSFHGGDLEGERYVPNFSRPHSICEDAPPVPALPVSRESSSRASSTQNVAELPPTSIKDVKARPGQPREDVAPASTPSVKSKPQPEPKSARVDWDSHRQLWRQRRKSIGEGLLRRSTEPPPDTVKAPACPGPAAPAIVISRYITPTQHPSSSAAIATASASPSKRPPSSSIAALAARFEQQESQPSSALRSRSTDSARSSTKSTAEDARDSMFDRYSGGLDYGYEAGFGLGGSAGTRNLRSAASRKSMHFAHRFGVDLSDVPVFVTRGG